MPLDFALAPSPTTPGKLTLAIGEDGDFALDEAGVYPVMTALHAHKGEWRWSPALGTLLHTIKNERRSLTTSQIQAAGEDALAQSRTAQPPWIASDGSSAVAMRDPVSRRWSLTLRWRTPSGADASQKVDF